MNIETAMKIRSGTPRNHPGNAMMPESRKTMTTAAPEKRTSVRTMSPMNREKRFMERRWSDLAGWNPSQSFGEISRFHGESIVIESSTKLKRRIRNVRRFFHKEKSRTGPFRKYQ
jgi:hypothetical protein